MDRNNYITIFILALCSQSIGANTALNAAQLNTARHAQITKMSPSQRQLLLVNVRMVDGLIQALVASRAELMKYIFQNPNNQAKKLKGLEQIAHENEVRLKKALQGNEAAYNARVLAILDERIREYIKNEIYKEANTLYHNKLITPGGVVQRVSNQEAFKAKQKFLQTKLNLYENLFSIYEGFKDLTPSNTKYANDYYKAAISALNAAIAEDQY